MPGKTHYMRVSTITKQNFAQIVQDYRRLGERAADPNIDAG